MINNNTLLTNPPIPDGYYFSKVVDVESEASDYLFPKLLIKLTLHPMYATSDDNEVSAILHPTDRSYYHYKNFYNTFMLGEDTSDLWNVGFDTDHYFFI